jgi:cobalamin biosynthesis protein CobC
LRERPASSGIDHGGDLQDARRLFPAAPEPFIDLSTGINSVPYPVPTLSDEAWTRLPEREAITALEAAAARAYGVTDPAMVVAAPGSQILISLLPRLFPQASVAILGPTYGEYAAAFAAAGCSVVEVARLDQLKGAQSVIICNPNNPDGRRLDPSIILSFARDNKDAGLIVVDEAFADLEDPSLSLAPYLPQPGLVVLRSFSKSWGLAGLRLGFALASHELAATIKAALGPWQVSGPAIEIGTRALADRPWLDAAKKRLSGDVQRLDAMLNQAGLPIIGGTLLFRLVRSDRAAELFVRLGQAGILVRRFEQRRNELRFGLPGGEEDWQRLAEALTRRKRPP